AAALTRWGTPHLGGWVALAEGVNFLLSFALTTVTFALIYKVMPRVRVQWRDVWIGATVTALLFTVGKFLIGLYIGKSTFASGFGAAASLVVLLLWMYYSAQIFLLGAEFTWVYAHVAGSRRSAAPPPSAADAPTRSGAQPFAADPGTVADALDRSRAAIAAAVERLRR
ncbi:MAG: YihY/virulence factor BrkB family protein, partial [Caldimonas sp.]